MSRTRKRSLTLLTPLILAIGSIVPPANAGSSGGYLTPQSAYLTLDASVPSGSSLLPIINSGDQIGSFTLPGLPDGMGVKPGRHGTVQVFLNHEESRVPFLNEADFHDSSVSKLVLSRYTGAVKAASVALPDSAGFIRFCSATMVGPEQGFKHYTVVTNEESNDLLDVPSGATYGPDPSVTPQRQAGYAVLLDPASGEFRPVAGLGRMNHENSIVVPGGWGGVTMLTGDDTFSAPSSQLYMFRTWSERALWNDRGSLWAFQVTRTDSGKVDPWDPFNGANDYGDIELGDDWQGRFIRVPDDIARGTTGEAPQTALENWSNANNVFQFVRVEDLDYDRNNNRVVYFTDTSTTRLVPDPTTGRLMRLSSGTGLYDNGRVFRMELSAKNPKYVKSFSILLDGDSGGPGLTGVAPITNPDNVAASRHSLMVQEDTTAVSSRVWNYDFGSHAWSVVATVNDQNWESTGIVDVSKWFGPGAWLLAVQAHGSAYWIDSEFIDPTTYKTEAGQVLLLKLPGS
jgi:hypothetical protein